MTKSYIIHLFSALLFFTVSGIAQELVWHQGIVESNVNLRGSAVVVGSIDIIVPSDGKVVVHFDGSCTPDMGDRIVLAASNTPSWGPNDGNVSVFGTSDVPRASFSHSRAYDVTAGSYTYYAVAQNYVDQGGSGVASIYGSLTVEYFADASTSAFAAFQGIVETNVNLRGSPVVVGQIDINPSFSGVVIVHFDGSCTPDMGDRIVLAASNTPSWSSNDGNVSVFGTSGVPRASFSHSRAYGVTPGPYTLYAVAQNYVDQGGSGVASIYGSLTVEYFEDVSAAAFQGIVETNVNLRGAPVVVGQVEGYAPEAGKVEVHFDGSCTPDLGDRIVLAASNTTGWSPNDGNVSVLGTNGVPRASFSHTRAYDVAAGPYTFYAVAQNYVDQGGSGVASVYGSLTAKYFNVGPSGVRHISNNPVDFSLNQNYPNPFNPSTTIKYTIPKSSDVVIKVFDVLGNDIATLVNEQESVGTYEVTWDAANLTSGVYYYQIKAGNYINTKKMLLLK